MENCQSLTNGLMPSRWTSTDSAQSLFFDCHDLSTIVIYRKEQISSRTMQRNLKERKGANYQYYATLIILNCAPLSDGRTGSWRWRSGSWSLSSSSWSSCLPSFLLRRLLCDMFSLPLSHFSAFYMILVFFFTMMYVLLLEFTIKISESHADLLEELMGISHKETQTRTKSPKM